MASPIPIRRARRGAPRRLRLATLAAVSLAAAVALVGLRAAPAGAHASVNEVSPNAGEVLDESPASVKIWFTGNVDPKLGGVFVYDSDGSRVPTGTLRQPSPDQLVLPIEGELDDGSYIVAWRSVSDDGHAIQGTWTFQVGNASASAATVQSVADRLLAGQRADRSVAIGWAAARWTVFASMALLLGGVAFGAVIWPRARDARATRRVVTAGWIGLTVSTVVGLVLFGVYSRGGGLIDAFDPDAVRDTLDTRLGTVWLARLALLVVAFPLLRVLFARRPAAAAPLPQWWLPAVAVVGVGLVCTPGLAGHASTGDHQLLALIADGLHVAAMAVWLGGLVVLATAVLPRDDVDEMRAAVTRFSPIALWCVGVLVVTGVFQTWRLVGGLDALREDEFGRILVVKLVVFALLLVAASLSRDLVNRALRAPVPSRAVPVVSGAAVDLDERPAADPDPEPDSEAHARELTRLRRSVWAEVALGALVLVVTALLVNAAPPSGATSQAVEPSGVTMEDPRVTLDITVAPGAAGLNDVHVNTYGPAGAPLDVQLVDISLSLPERDFAALAVPLRKLAPGHFFSPGFDIPLSGTWQVQATVRLGPVDRVDLTGALEIR